MTPTTQPVAYAGVANAVAAVAVIVFDLPAEVAAPIVVIINAMLGLAVWHRVWPTPNHEAEVDRQVQRATLTATAVPTQVRDPDMAIDRRRASWLVENAWETATVPAAPETGERALRQLDGLIWDSYGIEPTLEQRSLLRSGLVAMITSTTIPDPDERGG